VTNHIEAVAFDCYGTLVDFGDEAFTRAYGQICAEQGLAVDGKTFFDKWMEVWRRLANDGLSSDAGSVGVVPAGALELNQPGPLSTAEVIPPHPQHHTPSAGRNRALDGPLPDYRPYRDEWPEHFAICFEELGLKGDAEVAHLRLRDLLAEGQAFPESRRVVETVGRRLPIAVMSNADDDFLRPCLARNGLVFPVVVSSETAQAYKPHVAIFRALSDAAGVLAERMLYVGDSRLADVAGAKNAGMSVAWINRRGARNRSLEVSSETSPLPGIAGLPSFEPDYEIDSLELLIDILDLR